MAHFRLALTTFVLILQTGSGHANPVTSSASLTAGQSAGTFAALEPTIASSRQSTAPCCQEQASLTAAPPLAQLPSGVSEAVKPQILMESEASNYNDSQNMMSLIVFSYVSTLCLLAVIGMVGVAITFCRPENQSPATHTTHDGYQRLD